MDTDHIVYFSVLISLAIALGAILFKWWSFKALVKKEHIHLPIKVFGFYSEERLNSTTSRKKRDFMTMSNWSTGIMYIGLLPVVILLISTVISEVEKLLAAS